MFVFDAMLGKAAYYGTLPGANDSLILVPFQVSSLLDEDLLGYATLTDLGMELTESPIGRITATGITSGVGWVGLTNDGWLSPATNPQITRLVICYKPDTASTDADIIPMVSLDVDFTPDSISDFSIDLSNGYFEATGYTYL
jgi:hypothetical protein